MTTTALVLTFPWISYTVALSFSVKITIKVVSAFVIFRLDKFKLISKKKYLIPNLEILISNLKEKFMNLNGKIKLFF